jgi:hypothetical protein
MGIEKLCPPMALSDGMKTEREKNSKGGFWQWQKKKE